MSKQPFILYKFASRTRPEKFFAALDNIIQMAKLPASQYHILATIDNDDTSMYNPLVNERIAKQYSSFVSVNYGTSKNKIHAINRGLIVGDTLTVPDKKAILQPGIPDFDILVIMSDDMQFIQPGFDVDIVGDFEKYYPDFDGVLHYPDGSPNKHILTMSIMGRKYYERFGYVYHPDYESVCCDMEAQEVAKMLNKITYIEKDMFLHNHPAWGKAKMDEQYHKTESPHVHNRDKQVYETRKNRGFDLNGQTKTTILPEVVSADTLLRNRIAGKDGSDAAAVVLPSSAQKEPAYEPTHPISDNPDPSVNETLQAVETEKPAEPKHIITIIEHANGKLEVKCVNFNFYKFVGMVEQAKAQVLVDLHKKGFPNL